MGLAFALKAIFFVLLAACLRGRNGPPQVNGFLVSKSSKRIPSADRMTNRDLGFLPAHSNGFFYSTTAMFDQERLRSIALHLVDYNCQLSSHDSSCVDAATAHTHIRQGLVASTRDSKRPFIRRRRQSRLDMYRGKRQHPSVLLVGRLCSERRRWSSHNSLSSLRRRRDPASHALWLAAATTKSTKTTTTSTNLTSSSRQEEEWHNKKWMAGFERLLEYKREHGHVVIPFAYNDGGTPHLGIWVNNQRVCYGRNQLSKSRVHKLVSVGFQWQIKADPDETWESAFQRLIVYKNKHEHTNVPSRYNDNQSPHLGHWVMTQRTQYLIFERTNATAGQITKDRVEKLNTIGFQWNPGRKEEYDDIWFQNFAILKALKHKYNTTKIFKPPAETYHSMAQCLYWAANQRALYSQFMKNISSTITQERIDHLDSIDFGWTLQNKTAHDEWIYQYFKLFWHHHHFNNTMISEANGYNGKFVKWVSRQKESYHAGKLDQGKIDLLDELNFDWTLDPEASWEELFEELSQYHGRFNSTLINSNINKGLGGWTMELRALYATGDLDPKWAARLNSLDFQWYATDDINWNAMFDRLLAYKAQHGDTLVPTRYSGDSPLGGWIKTQRIKYWKHFEGEAYLSDHLLGIVSEKAATARVSSSIHHARLTKLFDVGFVFDPHEAEWLEMYKMLVEYQLSHGNTVVPKTFPKLDVWVKHQREKRFLHSEGKQKLLNDIGFEWDPHDAQWQEMFSKLSRVKEETGNANVSCHHEDYKLGNWVRSQRGFYKEKRLAKHRIEALDSLGFVWSFKE